MLYTVGFFPLVAMLSDNGFTKTNSVTAKAKNTPMYTKKYFGSLNAVIETICPLLQLNGFIIQLKILNKFRKK